MHKNLHYNFLIRLLNACFTLPENIHAFVFPYFKPKIPQNSKSMRKKRQNFKLFKVKNSHRSSIVLAIV